MVEKQEVKQTAHVKGVRGEERKARGRRKKFLRVQKSQEPNCATKFRRSVKGHLPIQGVSFDSERWVFENVLFGETRGPNQ